MSDLAQRQAALVASLVAGAPEPAGFDTARLAAVRGALLRKRAEDVARVWPHLSEAYGESWTREFSAWAAGRPPQGALRDGWDFAHAHPAPGRAAELELAHARAAFSLRRNVLRPRRWRAARRLVLQARTRLASIGH
jgi:hypothetical protein